jgi:hypothetical protein
MTKLWITIALVLLVCMPAALGHTTANRYSRDGYGTYSDVDYKSLPVYNIYDPDERENNRITDYSYEELTSFFDDPAFLQWNDEAKVCESMELMFDKTNSYCDRMNGGSSQRVAQAMRVYVSAVDVQRYYGYDPQQYVVNTRDPYLGPSSGRYYRSIYDADTGETYHPMYNPYQPRYQIVRTAPVYPSWNPSFSPYYW